MNWLLFSLLAPFVWAIGNVGDKYIFSKYIKQPVVAVMVFAFVGVIASILIFIFRGFGILSWQNILIALLLGLVYLGANIFYYSAVQVEDVSKVISLVYLEPLFTAALSAIFLSEVFPPLKYIGVILLVFGAVVISQKRGEKFTLSKGLVFALISAFIYGVNNLFYKYMTNQTDFWTAFAYIRVGTFLGILPFYLKNPKPFNNLFKQVTSGVIVFSNNALVVLGILFYTIAISLGYLTLTSALSATQPLFVVIITLALAIFFPKILVEEKFRQNAWQKLLAGVLILAGALLVN